MADSEQVIREVYGPAAISYTVVPQSGSGTTYTDSAGLIALEDTLRDSSDAARTVDVSFSSTGAARLDVAFHDRWTTSSTDLSRYVQDATGFDHFVNVEVSFTRVVNGQTVPDTGVTLRVQCKNAAGVFKDLPTSDAEVEQGTNRNVFGQLRGSWAVYNDHVFVSPNHRNQDPSVIRLVPTTADNHAFTMKVDLVQVVPFKCVRAEIEPANCVPALNGTQGPRYETATTVQSSVFASTTGFVLAWNGNLATNPILHYPTPPTTQSRPYYVYIYRGTGTWLNPYGNITCLTEQLADTGADPDPTLLRIYYRPNPTGERRPLPAGQYTISTRWIPPLMPSACDSIVVGQLRSNKLGVGAIGDPQVANETVVIDVPYSGPSLVGITEEDCVRNPNCVADVDNGMQSGMPDGGVGIEDLLYYLVMYDQGVVCADVDDGTATATRDGGVGIEDLIYYLQRYDVGC